MPKASNYVWCQICLEGLQGHNLATLNFSTEFEFVFCSILRSSCQNPNSNINTCFGSQFVRYSKACALLAVNVKYEQCYVPKKKPLFLFLTAVPKEKNNTKNLV